jgi:hypothetical protein
VDDTVSGESSRIASALALVFASSAEHEPLWASVQTRVTPPAVEPVQGLDIPKLPRRGREGDRRRTRTGPREEIRIGRVKQLGPLARIAPRLADRIVVPALRPG